MISRNQQLFERAKKHIPGGVNSPVRAFRSVGGTPLFFQKGAGAKVQDADGKWYTDYVGSWGPMILGHAHPAIVDAVRSAATGGLSFGAPTLGEVELAEEIVARVDPVEEVRLVNSGTEATMSAVRLARGFTGRAKIIKFAGCYHGHVDALLAEVERDYSFARMFAGGLQLGSLAAVVFSRIMSSDGTAFRGTLGDAVTAAGGDAALIETAKSAYVTGVHAALGTAAVILAVMAVVATVVLPQKSNAASAE